MIWTIIKIVLIVALLIGRVYGDYKYRIFAMKTKQHSIKSSMITGGCIGGFVVLCLEPLYHWLQPYIASEGLRTLICLVVFFLVVIIISLVSKYFARNQFQKESENEA